MTRWKITIEYKGTQYAGWQIQNGHKTVQETIQKAIHGFCQREITIVGAGRTDSGVHARGQVAHFDLDYGTRALNGYNLAKAINAHLIDEEISILKAEEVDGDFHARFSAKKKLYTYSIMNRVSKPAIDRDLVWHIGRDLDDAAMQQAANHLLGTHDFTSFRATECQAKSPIRTLDALRVEKMGDYVFIHAEAQSFLHHQVRNIAGTLALVGEGKWRPDEVRDALEAKDRRRGGITAPAQGLSLIYIGYQ